MINIINLSASYSKKNDVLQNINLHIHKKEKVFFIGKSGAGKTSLFNCLTNRKIIYGGKILIDKKNILELSKKSYKKMLQSFALISQINTCNEELNVFNNIYKDMKLPLGFLKFLGVSSSKNTKKILNLLNNLDIFEQAFKKYKDLSGGQKQRVEIAKAIINKHNLIIADEPTSSLDIKIAKKVISDLLKNTNTTALIAVHNLELIPSNARLVAIKNKKIIFDKKKNQLTEKEIKNIYEK